MIRKVVLGISGGVDSAVAGLLLKRKGFDVTGVFMRCWDKRDEKGICSVDKDAEDAHWVCKQLDIPFKEVNFVKDYWNDVFCYFLDEYANGRTPNPDIFCNKHIKFNKFIHHAFENEQADMIATGHYARTSHADKFDYDYNTDTKLLQAFDSGKDQTFFLSQISETTLRKTMFPLGDINKKAVKEMANLNGLQRIAQKRESTGICFIGKRKFRDFISEYILDKPGEFIDIETKKCIGNHRGLHHWTVGQKSNIQGFDQKYFICSKDVKNNYIYACPGTHHPSLYTSSVEVENFHWIQKPPTDLISKGRLECQFRTQHRHQLVSGIVTPSVYNYCQENPCLGSCTIVLEKPLRAVTPGQFAVLYKGDECLGSGKIISTGPSLYELNEQPNVLDDSTCYITTGT